MNATHENPAISLLALIPLLILVTYFIYRGSRKLQANNFKSGRAYPAADRGILSSPRDSGSSAETISVDISFKPILLPPIPEKFHGPFKIAGRSAGKSAYTVDLKELKCTCLEFIERRASFKPRDIRRICKHLSECLDNLNVEFDSLREEMIQHRPAQKNTVSLHLKSGERVVLLYDDEDSWIDVFAKGARGDVYKRFSYKRRGGQWFHDERPFEFEAIVQMIARHLPG